MVYRSTHALLKVGLFHSWAPSHISVRYFFAQLYRLGIAILSIYSSNYLVFITPVTTSTVTLTIQRIHHALYEVGLFNFEVLPQSLFGCIFRLN